MIGWVVDAVPLWLWMALAAGALLLAWRLLGLRGVIAAAGAMAGFLAYRSGRKQGGDDDRAKRQREIEKARQERAEMQQEGKAAEQAAEALTDEEARKEALEWSRKR